MARNKNKGSSTTKKVGKSKKTSQVRSITSRLHGVYHTRNIVKKHFNPRYYAAIVRIDQGVKLPTKLKVAEGLNARLKHLAGLSPRLTSQRKMRDNNRLNSISKLKNQKCRPRPDPNSGSGGGRLRFFKFCK